MANLKVKGSGGFGINDEIAGKISAKWSQEEADKAMQWMTDLTGSDFSAGFHETLKSGVVLCKLINKINGSKITKGKISTSKMAFPQRENIVKYLTACKKLGMGEVDLFVTVDLFEADNLHQVLLNLNALSSLARLKIDSFNGPYLNDIKLAQKTKTDFVVKASGSGGLTKSQAALMEIAKENASKSNFDTRGIVKTGDNPAKSSGGLGKADLATLERSKEEEERNKNTLDSRGIVKTGGIESVDKSGLSKTEQFAVEQAKKAQDLPAHGIIKNREEQQLGKSFDEKEPETTKKVDTTDAEEKEADVGPLVIKASSQEQEVSLWVEAIRGKKFKDPSASLFDKLKSGVAICAVVNKLGQALKGAKLIKKFNNPAKKPFKMRENIGLYLNACQKLGVRGQDVFETNDLYEGSRMEQVILNLYALSAATQKLKFGGPFIGVKLASVNKRKFTEEQLRKAKNIVPKFAQGSIQHETQTSIGGQIVQNAFVKDSS